MEYTSLILVHVFFGVLWAGGAIAAGIFIIPSVLEAGPGGGAVMAGVLKRRFPLLMTVAAVLVVLTGLRLYMLRFSLAWLGTPHGIVLSLGALAGLGAFVVGVFVQKPTADKLGALAAKLASAGGSPSPEDAAEVERLRTRLGKVARVTAWHLVVAALLMAAHQLAARF
jgi:uncharacterized membrane protein